MSDFPYLSQPFSDNLERLDGTADEQREAINATSPEDVTSALGYERSANPGIAGVIWNSNGELRFSLGPTILSEDGEQFFQPDGNEFLLIDE